jgi:hypothetical protein
MGNLGFVQLVGSSTKDKIIKGIRSSQLFDFSTLCNDTRFEFDDVTYFNLKTQTDFCVGCDSFITLAD